MVIKDDSQELYLMRADAADAADRCGAVKQGRGGN